MYIYIYILILRCNYTLFNDTPRKSKLFYWWGQNKLVVKMLTEVAEAASDGWSV